MPITDWLPNQIDACFVRMQQLLDFALPARLSGFERRWHAALCSRLAERRRILADQRALLRNPAFDPRAVYALNTGHEDESMR